MFLNYFSWYIEFDVSGISDPYLQIQILIFFRLMAEGNKELSDEVSDTLANVQKYIYNHIIKIMYIIDIFLLF